MTPDNTQFRTGVIKPVECLKEAWELIKGQYWLFFGICVVGMLIGSAFAIVLMGPMMCGMFLCLLQHMRGEKVSFEGLFKGFDFFAESIIAILIQAIPAVIIIVPVTLIMVIPMVASMTSSRGRGGDEVAVAGFFFSMIVIYVVIFLLSIILGTFFFFTFLLIVDRKLSGVEAVKTSVKAALANFGGVLGLVLLNALLSLAGLLLCYFGAFFVLPITITAHAIAYRRVFPEISQSFASPPPPPANWAA
jgi:uncharacterized membrane protein